MDINGKLEELEDKLKFQRELEDLKLLEEIDTDAADKFNKGVNGEIVDKEEIKEKIKKIKKKITKLEKKLDELNVDYKTLLKQREDVSKRMKEVIRSKSNVKRYQRMYMVLSKHTNIKPTEVIVDKRNKNDILADNLFSIMIFFVVIWFCTLSIIPALLVGVIMWFVFKFSDNTEKNILEEWKNGNICPVNIHDLSNEDDELTCKLINLESEILSLSQELSSNVTKEQELKAMLPTTTNIKPISHEHDMYLEAPKKKKEKKRKKDNHQY